MLAGIRKRLTRKQLDIKECEDDEKDDLHATAFVPPTNYIKISQGKIQLVHQPPLTPTTITTPTTQLSPPTSSPPPTFCNQNICNGLESPKDKSQCGSPTFEKELRQQLENMSRVIKSKERKQLQTCRDHKALQTRFARQENLLHTLQQENKALLLRIRQYEHCLDDVMRKVVDAIVAEDNLREEVALLKGRVRDLEAQNAALSASPAKGRDEGYCTMSSGQPQPSNGHLEDLPEEPEQWLLPAEPCSTEMEDWSMSQEELAVITLDEEREQEQHQQHKRQQKLGENDWIWNSTELLNSTMVETDSVADNISQLLQQKIIYSEDEEVACTEFTNDFYKLVNIRSSSARSLYSYIEGDTDDEDDDDDEEEEEDSEEEEDDDGNSSLSPSHKRLRSKVLKSRQKATSPTPSEAGRAQVTSCSSSETDDFSHCTTTHQAIILQTLKENETMAEDATPPTEEEETVEQHSDIEIEDVQLDGDLQTANNIIMNHTNHQRHLSDHMSEKECIEQIIKSELSRTPRHKLMKSQSTIEERETNHILRNRQQQNEQISQVVRSGSVNGNLVLKARYQERLQNTNNSWRRSNGWKRVISPSQSPTMTTSPKKEIKTNELKSPPKATPTRIPSCKSAANSSTNNQQPPKVSSTLNSNHLQNSQQSSRKSKIPPPVPVRRSYAS